MIWVARFRCSRRSGASRHALPVPTRLLLSDPEPCHDSWYLLGSDEGYVLWRWIQVTLLRWIRDFIFIPKALRRYRDRLRVDVGRGPRFASNDYHMLGYLIGDEE